MAAIAVAPVINAGRIKQALKERGLTQRAVAARLGRDPIEVSRALGYAKPGGLLEQLAATAFDAIAAPEEGPK